VEKFDGGESYPRLTSKPVGRDRSTWCCWGHGRPVAVCMVRQAPRNLGKSADRLHGPESATGSAVATSASSQNNTRSLILAVGKGGTPGRRHILGRTASRIRRTGQRILRNSDSNRLRLVCGSGPIPTEP